MREIKELLDLMNSVKSQNSQVESGYLQKVLMNLWERKRIG